jgi:hypothetical protein
VVDPLVREFAGGQFPCVHLRHEDELGLPVGSGQFAVTGLDPGEAQRLDVVAAVALRLAPGLPDRVELHEIRAGGGDGLIVRLVTGDGVVAAVVRVGAGPERRRDRVVQRAGERHRHAVGQQPADLRRAGEDRHAAVGSALQYVVPALLQCAAQLGRPGVGIPDEVVAVGVGGCGRGGGGTRRQGGDRGYHRADRDQGAEPLVAC